METRDRGAPVAGGALGDETRPPRILFVDDEPNILRALKRLFRREPWDQRFVGSGREALELLAAEGEFDVVVTDQRMPGMTGVELLREVRERCPQCARIVLSGYTDVQSILDAVNEGHIFKFLTKPWDDEVLRHAVAEAAEAVRLREENARLQARVRCHEGRLVAASRCREAVARNGVEARSAGLAQAVIDALPVAVVARGEDGTVALANPEALRILGGEGEDLLGKPWESGTVEGRPGLAARRADGIRAPGWTGTCFVFWRE